MGFHNPVKTMNTLAVSLECSERAVALATEATQFTIAPIMAKDIREVVPPILELSRKLQQDGEFLQKNTWTKLLPVLPKADQVWDGQNRLESSAAPR